MNMHPLIKKALWGISLSLSLTITPNVTLAGGGHGHEEAEEHHDEPQKGPHGGRLLEDGPIAVELAIFEKGVPPEYHAWITRNDQPVAPASVTLTVELIRLGGQVDRFSFTPKDDYLLGSAVVTEPHSFDVKVVTTVDGNTHSWEYDSYEGRVQLSADTAEKAGITTALAASGELHLTKLLYGKIIADPQRVSHIRARFPGVITQVHTSLGNTVKAGQPLIEIESNESLKRYAITAPISGIVIEKHANVGEFSGDQALMTLANYDQVWMELSVFSQDAAVIKPGQNVKLRHDSDVTEGRIAYMTPVQGDAPYLIARIPLDNEKRQWTPGTFAEAGVVVDTIKAPLLVDNRGLQSFRDWQVVFIKVDDTYEIRPLELGRTDGRFTEVLEGLQAGDRYVLENSYLLKADLEKSGASHDH